MLLAPRVSSPRCPLATARRATRGRPTYSRMGAASTSTSRQEKSRPRPLLRPGPPRRCSTRTGPREPPPTPRRSPRDVRLAGSTGPRRWSRPTSTRRWTGSSSTPPRLRCRSITRSPRRTRPASSPCPWSRLSRPAGSWSVGHHPWPTTSPGSSPRRTPRRVRAVTSAVTPSTPPPTTRPTPRSGTTPTGRRQGSPLTSRRLGSTTPCSRLSSTSSRSREERGEPRSTTSPT